MRRCFRFRAMHSCIVLLPSKVRTTIALTTNLPIPHVAARKPCDPGKELGRDSLIPKRAALEAMPVRRSIICIPSCRPGRDAVSAKVPRSACAMAGAPRSLQNVVVFPLPAYDGGPCSSDTNTGTPQLLSVCQAWGAMRSCGMHIAVPVRRRGQPRKTYRDPASPVYLYAPRHSPDSPDVDRSRDEGGMDIRHDFHSFVAPR